MVATGTGGDITGITTGNRTAAIGAITGAAIIMVGTSIVTTTTAITATIAGDRSSTEW